MDAIKLVRSQINHDDTVVEVTDARHDGINQIQYQTLKLRLDAMTQGLDEVDDKINDAIAGLQWKESVPNYGALATTYPVPKEGWTASVDDTNEVYRYDETDQEWKKLIDLSVIQKATQDIDGLMSKEDKTKLDNIDSVKLVTTDGGQVITGNLTVQGGVIGNSSTATALETARDITLEGDATGTTSFDGTANAVINVTLGNVPRNDTNVTENPIPGGTFTAISGVTTDTKGRVTDVETKTVTLPIAAATDEQVKNIPNDTVKAYLTGTTNVVENTGIQVFDPGVYLDVDSGHLTATQFNGILNGNASTATALETPRNINGKPFDGTGDIDITGEDIELTGYTKGQTYSPITENDTINVALGKLEAGLDGKLDNTVEVNLTSTVTEHTVTQNTVNEVLIGSEVLATDVLMVYLSGVRLHPVKHYTVTFGDAQTAKITAVGGVEFIKDDHLTFEILKAKLV